MNDFTRTKFFKLLVDLQRLAQFDTTDDFQRRNTIRLFAKENQADEEYFRQLDFTPAMIRFAEENYHDARH